MTPTTQLRVLRKPFLQSRHASVLLCQLSAGWPSTLSTVEVRPRNRQPRHGLVLFQLRFASTTAESKTIASSGKSPSSSSLVTTAPIISRSAANPPDTTRPPPLELPIRVANQSTVAYLFAIGKAYLTFYKTGLKNIYTNTRLLYNLTSGSGLPSDSPVSPSDTSSVASPPVVHPVGLVRSTELLRARWIHDIRRVPVFLILLFICGELTPFVVLALPGTVPFTCRIPRQVDKLQRQAEERRRGAFTDLHALRAELRARTGSEELSATQVARHITRGLGLVSNLWERVGIPAPLAAAKARRRLAFLAQDDALLLQSGGVPALETPEMRLACVDRGIDVLGKSDDELAGLLTRWLELTRARGTANLDGERLRRVQVLLTTPLEEWPEDGDFELPEKGLI